MTQPSPTNPAQRRIVLLAADGSVECVLAEPPAIEAHAELVRQAAEYSGRTVAAEHLSALGWQRWLTMKGKE